MNAKRSTPKAVKGHAKAHNQIVSDARKTYYKALEVEFSRLVKDGCRAKDFTMVESDFYQYGMYLETHPDALKVV